jgi:hypothetical protein
MIFFLKALSESMKKTFTPKQWNLNFCKPLIAVLLCFAFLPGFPQSTWSVISTPSPDSSGSLMLLLSDGSVLCKSSYGGGDGIGNIWNKLSPDINGSYINGTWSRACPMKDTRLYFSSQTLKNGKIYVAGGEYGTGGGFGEIYDPLTNSWTQLPNTNNYLGDANSAILEDGRIMQASLSAFNKILFFDPVTNSYSNGPGCLGGHDEATWLTLPDKSILFVDIGSTNAERYIPALNQWIADATVPANLYDPYGSETGPGFLLPDGRALFMGSLGNTAIYTPSGNNSPGSWAVGPTIPGNNGMPDAAGSMMADGKIIISAGPKPVSLSGLFVPPTYYYEYDYLNNSFTQLSAPGGGLSLADTAFNGTMLNLPDGTVMLSRQGSKNYYVHKPAGLPLAAGKPTITAVAQNGCTNTCTLTGLLFNGICEGSCYGDDWQMNTNFPIVRLSSGSGVYYARSYNWNRTGVKTGTLPDTTLFDLPPNLPNGTYSLSVIANGNGSDPVTFTFAAFPALTSPLFMPDICSGNSFSYNAVANMTNANVMWTRAAVTGITNAAILTPQSGNPNETLVNPTGISKTVVYSYTLTNGNCITHYPVSVVVHPVGVISINGNTTTCDNAPITLTASGVASYSWSAGAVTNTITVNPLATTIYSVSGYSFNGCLSSQEITVTVKPSPTLSITGASIICQGETIVLTASGNAINYSWNTGSVINTITVSPATNTTYSVNGSLPDGCYSPAAITVTVQTCNGIRQMNSNNVLSAYPNPLQEKLTIEYTTAQEGMHTIQVYDVFGRLVKKEERIFTKESDRQSIDVSDLVKGVYLLILSKDSTSYKTTLVKE